MGTIFGTLRNFVISLIEKLRRMVLLIQSIDRAEEPKAYQRIIVELLKSETQAHSVEAVWEQISRD